MQNCKLKYNRQPSLRPKAIKSLYWLLDILPTILLCSTWSSQNTIFFDTTANNKVKKHFVDDFSQKPPLTSRF